MTGVHPALSNAARASPVPYAESPSTSTRSGVHCAPSSGVVLGMVVSVASSLIPTVASADSAPDAFVTRVAVTSPVTGSTTTWALNPFRR